MLEYGLIAMPLVGGVDTRSDAKAIAPPKLAVLSNGRFGRPGTIRKRQGYAKLGELSMYDVQAAAKFYDTPVSDARALFTRAGSLWLSAAENLYVLSTQRQRWMLLGQAPNVKVTYDVPLFPVDFGSGILVQRAERATTNGVTLVLLEGLTGASIDTYAICYDANGTELVRTLLANSQQCRAVIVGTAICVIFTNSPTPNSLRIVSFDTTAIKTGNPLAIQQFLIAADLSTTAPRFDADASNGRILLAYNTTTANTIKHGYLMPSGELDGAMSTITSAAAPTAIACAVEPTLRNYLVVWDMDSLPRVDGQMFSEPKASLFAATTIGTPAHLTARGESVTCIFRNASNAEVFFDTDDPLIYNGKVQRTTITTAGATTPFTTWMQHALIITKPWVVNGRVFLLIGNLVDVTSSTPAIQRSFYVVATGGSFSEPITVGKLYDSAGYTQKLANRHPMRPDVVGSRVTLTPLLYDPSTQITYPGSATLDHSFVPSAVEAGGATYLTGANLWMVDGHNVVEAGFLTFPENITAVQSVGAGSLVPGQTYSWRFYYVWYSQAGERFISTTATNVVVTMTGSNNTVTFTIPSLSHTNKTRVKLFAYRTLGNQTLFFFEGGADNDRTSPSIGFVSTVADTAIQSNELDYRSSDPPEFDNIPPPPCSVICAGNNRVWAAGFEDPNLVQPSKLQDFGTALNYSDVLTIALPPAPGAAPISAMAMMAEALVVFRETHIYVVSGDGPNNVGTLGQFDTPRTISDDIGCMTARSLIRIPNGLLFKSRKGIYLLGTDLSLSYVGADVDAYNGETITSAVSLSDVHEARFTLASGKTLVYDYVQQAWSVWTVGGQNSTLWQNTHVLLPGSTGLLLQEQAGVFSDNGIPYSLIIETPWLHVGGAAQGNQKVRRVLLLGEQRGDHKPLISLAYNYEPFFEDRQTWDPATIVGAQLLGGNGGLLGGGTVFGGNDSAGRPSTSVYQFRLFPARPRCQALKLRIEDMPRPGSPMGESYSLSEIAMEVAQRPGGYKPGADKAAS